MQLYVIDWLFKNSEDQLFATKKFCKFLKEDGLHKFIEGFELKFIVHTPQNGSGIIICSAQNTSTLFRIINSWRENYNISFNIKPALSNEELLGLTSSEDY